MTVAEARAEIKQLFEKADLIEKKYPDGDLPDVDMTEVKRLLTEIDGLEEKLAGLEDAESRRERITSGMDRYGKPASGRPNPVAEEYKQAMRVSPGDQFIQSREYRELKLSGAFNSSLARVMFAVQLKDGTSLVQWRKRLAIEEKALMYSAAAVGGGFVQNDIQAGYIDLLQREIQLLDLVPRVQTESDTIEYVKEDTFTNNAAAVAEATATTGTTGLKPESALAYSVATSPVRTVAHWVPVTNRMLSDAPAIRGIINGRLLLGLDLILETQILSGSGSGENMTGILNTAGINIQGLGTDSTVDAIFKARTQVRVNGKGRPGAVVLHPNDWEAIRLSRENAATGTLGGYLMGPPSQVGAVTLWGVPVVESEAITENTGLIGDFQMGATLYDREQAAVRVGTIDDQFVRNMQTILAELRAAFVVYRPAMFTKITGI
jgi:HK97 family phage major capsid protein